MPNLDLEPLPPFRQRPIIAAFDFDGTLTRHNTFLPFLYAISHSSLAFTRKLSGLLPFIQELLSGEAGRHHFKERVIRQFFHGISQVDLEKEAARFFSHKESRCFFPAALQRLEWHLEQQHHCYLVSANIAPFLAVWAARYPRLQLLATDLECRDGIYTGEVCGLNCWGEEKWRRLCAAMPLQKDKKDQKEWLLYAYGDSRGDHALLAHADYAHYRPFR